jgi:two-component system sensor histidine kinase BaeS
MKGTKAMSAFNFDTKINVDSKDELGKLADNFNQMAQTLKNSEEIRKNWISDISHELRTPIAILKGKVEALQDGIRKMTPETLDSLHADINRLQKLVEDLHLLSLADSETLHIKKEKIQPVRILNAILDDFQVRLDEAQIRVHIDFQDTLDSFFCGSKAHMERLFSNLIENSIRYTDASGHLKILCQKHQSFLQFVFEDSSPGVSEESLPLIFNRLYRDEKSRSRAHGGSGLGLSICSQIVENHQGTIHSDHSQEGGLKLTINLPLN